MAYEMTTSKYRIHRRASMPRRFFARVTGDQSGAAAIELALLAPVLTVMMVSVIDIGFGIYRKMQVENAAQAGAHYATRNGFDANAISNAVVSAGNSSSITASPAPVQFCGCATSSGIVAMSCGTTCPGGAVAGTYTTVSAQATYNTLLNYQVVPQNYDFRSQSTVRLQ
jgi:Flp pilus assembly protein TadG